MTLDSLKRSRILVALLAAFALGCDGDDAPPERIPVPDVAQSGADTRPAGSDASVGGATVAANGDATPVALEDVVVQVYKSPTCGCCSAWVEHMEAAGFEVESHDLGTRELAVLKAEHGVPPQHQSCHTALVGDYVLEGHVPADLVQKMLQDQPRIAGLAVPGMPLGSPGMEVPSGETQPYDVIAFTEDGREGVYGSR